MHTRMRRLWVLALACALTGVAVLAIALRLRQLHRTARVAVQSPPGEVAPLAPLAHSEPAPKAEAPRESREVEGAPVAGLDLLHIRPGPDGLIAPAGGGTAALTLDPELQLAATRILAAHHLPEAAVVLMDVATGRVLVYANHVEDGPLRDLCAEASAPSASVFKIVTAAALVEDAHLGVDTKECYSGGEQRIVASDLTPDPARDRWCSTLAGAMGRSINAIFARLAKEHLEPQELEVMARRFGYGEALPFDVPVQASALHVPSESLDFARTAAGFWNTTMSPLEAIEISAIVARGGETVRPSIVASVASASGAVVWSAPDAGPAHRAIAKETAEQLATMMSHTVSEGTSYRAFHDGHGSAFLPGIAVAGKTGTLTHAETRQFYTWFTGFAPMKADPEVPRVAIAVLVVNGPTWQVKANVVARDVLRAYFAANDVEGVTRPGAASTKTIARHKR
ncbi:MAG TPA: penicillin-binding transpeptidase domain-containing protein [Polyangiaceae bacterium]|nr:penicillin-binding transpeptidase domain-containing protein [Polyangiaceae bacterium]